MENKIKQTVLQINVNTTKRIIVQYVNEGGEDVQTINNYESFTDSEKLIFDSFVSLSENKMS